MSRNTVDVLHVRDNFVLFDDGDVPIGKDETLHVGGRADVDTQFPRQRCSLVPGFGAAGSVRFVGRTLLREGDRLVPRILVAVMHGAQQIFSIANGLGLDDIRRQQGENQDESLHLSWTSR